MGKIIEGVWDCSYCGAKRIRGSIRDCSQCGHPRDKGVAFYMADPQNYVFDEEIAAKVRCGPDWLCPACDCLNSAENTVCEGCGTERNAMTKDYFQNRVEQNTEYKRERENWHEFDPAYTPPEKEMLVQPVAEPPKVKKKTNWAKVLKIGAVALLVIALIAGMIALFTPKEVTGTVDSFAWSRTMEVEEYKTVRESDWSIPAGGREVSRSEEVHHYNQVISHYETKTRTYTEQVLDHYETVVTGYRDLGNGYFEEITTQKPVYRTETRTETYEEPVYVQIPIYETFYVYEIERWTHKSTEKVSGNDKEPYWPEYTFSDKERKGTFTETYTVKVTDEDGKTREFKLSFEEWNTLEVGQAVKLKTHVGGNAEIIS